MRLVSFILLVVLCNAAFAQSKRISHWYFGFGAGLDFSPGTAVNDRSGLMESLEGSAVMSDEQGNLLFYSNGEAVWNRNHVRMPHGIMIKGDQSSTQSTLIVPQPGNNHVYYLFSSVANGPLTGLYYNVVDMNLEGGRGDVDAAAGKDVQIMQLGSEQLAGTMHCNTTDFWILGRQVDADSLKFYAWLLTANGLSAPVISSFALPNNARYGTLCFSPDGRLLAMAILGFPYQPMDTYLFSFDVKRGRLALRQRIGARQGESLYSCAFSPDKTKLYISTFTSGPNLHYQYLSQFDLTANDVTASRVDLDSI
ncbi:MAG: hypothetical protein JST39_01670, partial [Bacteroidetes bacterium]|nr:hypothetical protein [Bacteroidota bacterium]